MPSYHLPIFPAGTMQINASLSFDKRDGQITYFNYMTPVYKHAENDKKSFRMITSQFCCLGVCRPIDIIKTFGVTKQTVYRDMKLYEKEGAAGFFKTVKRGGPTVITPEVKVEAEKLLSEGQDVKDVADELGIPYETLRKAIYRGKVFYKKKERVGEQVQDQDKKKKRSKSRTIII